MDTYSDAYLHCELYVKVARDVTKKGVGHEGEGGGGKQNGREKGEMRRVGGREKMRWEYGDREEGGRGRE